MVEHKEIQKNQPETNAENTHTHISNHNEANIKLDGARQTLFLFLYINGLSQFANYMHTSRLCISNVAHNLNILHACNEIERGTTSNKCALKLESNGKYSVFNLFKDCVQSVCIVLCCKEDWMKERKKEWKNHNRNEWYAEQKLLV